MIDFDQLDRLIHEKSRLAIMTLLATREDWSFQDLKAELGLSDGNLITHMRALLRIAHNAQPAARLRTWHGLLSCVFEVPTQQVSMKSL